MFKTYSISDLSLLSQHLYSDEHLDKNYWEERFEAVQKNHNNIIYMVSELFISSEENRRFVLDNLNALKLGRPRPNPFIVNGMHYLCCKIIIDLIKNSATDLEYLQTVYNGLEKGDPRKLSLLAIFAEAGLPENAFIFDSLTFEEFQSIVEEGERFPWIKEGFGYQKTVLGIVNEDSNRGKYDDMIKSYSNHLHKRASE